MQYDVLRRILCVMRNDAATPPTPELKKGSLELLVLSVLAHSPRHGYEIGRLIELGSGGHLTLRITTLYPVLYRLENRGLIAGRWVERAGEPRWSWVRSRSRPCCSSARACSSRALHGCC
jgi:hypothetical protein